MTNDIIEDGVRVYLDKDDEVLKVHFDQRNELARLKKCWREMKYSNTARGGSA